MKRSDQTRPDGTPLPIRFSKEQLVEINETAKLLGVSKQDTIRMACRIGVKILKRVGADGIAQMLADQAEKSAD